MEIWSKMFISFGKFTCKGKERDREILGEGILSKERYLKMDEI